MLLQDNQQLYVRQLQQAVLERLGPNGRAQLQALPAEQQQQQMMFLMRQLQQTVSAPVQCARFA